MLGEDFAHMTFTSETEPILFFENTNKIAGRLSQDIIDNLPDDVDIDALRAMLSKYFYAKLENSYAKLEACCDIKRNTFQKVLNFSNGRNVTYILLAKFCVGAQLSVEEAEELFQLLGHTLTDANRPDAILRYELKTHQDLMEYNKDLMENCACYKEHGIISAEN